MGEGKGGVAGPLPGGPRGSSRKRHKCCYMAGATALSPQTAVELESQLKFECAHAPLSLPWTHARAPGKETLPVPAVIDVRSSCYRPEDLVHTSHTALAFVGGGSHFLQTCTRPLDLSPIW